MFGDLVLSGGDLCRVGLLISHLQHPHRHHPVLPQTIERGAEITTNPCDTSKLSLKGPLFFILFSLNLAIMGQNHISCATHL